MDKGEGVVSGQRNFEIINFILYYIYGINLGPRLQGQSIVQKINKFFVYSSAFSKYQRSSIVNVIDAKCVFL